MQLLWQLSSTDTCTIEWGVDTFYTAGNSLTMEYGNAHQHTFTFLNLIPGTKYFYRLSVNNEIYTGSFRSAPDANDYSIKFLAYGDTRSYPDKHNSVAGQILSTILDEEQFQSIVIVVGDLVNNGNSSSDWDNQFFNPSYTNIKTLLAIVPYQTAMGNHEGSGQLFIQYFPYPFVANRYWSFDYGPAHFVVVDQYTNYDPGSQQLAWIESDLASTTKQWKFIYFHEPGWSAGGGHGNNTAVQNYIQPLCEQYGVAIVFAGHNHYYARAEVNDVQHITTGGGGAPLHYPEPGWPHVITSTRAYHFCGIEIDSTKLTCKVIKTGSSVIDSFTIDLSVVDIDLQKNNTSTKKFELYPAFPNPFNSSTIIGYSLPNASDVQIEIYNILGKRLVTLLSAKKQAGYHTADFDGSTLSSGVYLYRIQAGEFTEVKKMVLMR
jgi:hypothetical protein